jgi:hypothetical protein
MGPHHQPRELNLGSPAQQHLLYIVRCHQATGPFEMTASHLATEANESLADADIVLSTLASADELKREVQHICPCDRQERLEPEEASCQVCVYCDRAFGTDVGKPSLRHVYRHEAPVTRDVRWVLALHGMNTRGSWQEEFMWRIARTYGYSVPVAIYKYGMVRAGAVLKFRQRALTRQLQEKMQLLLGSMEETGFGGPPDVVAHSFGTWLLGHALLADPSLHVGRVILLGSILRPDFDWTSLLQQGQVEAVLCQYSACDFWAGISHYVIPDSGPSGRIGFNDRGNVIHVQAAALAHSDYFLPRYMPELFQAVWEPFLTRPKSRLKQLVNSTDMPAWHQAPWVGRATLLRFALLILTAALFAIGAVALALGLYHLLLLSLGETSAFGETWIYGRLL